ncbi:N-acetyltransferase [Streptomyces ferrugineus]|uniref:N-acetyltransferase n=1 Tax=Streptomyces ferrugineus TaxID=1413221 RepID=A0A7M2SPD8_9ACTN|nr:peptidogalycan biosysnthesis protein [Streptomyces ferrugineus]QOV37338.1 N-acetyltransferase [Streptomyces ferrugineus]
MAHSSSSARDRDSGLHRSLAWLEAEEGRVSREAFYVSLAGTLASCYPLPHTALHRTYATWEILCGAPVEELIRQLPQRQRESAEAELAFVRSRLPAEATDTLAVVTPGCVFPGVSLSAKLTADDLNLLVGAVEAQAQDLGLPVVEFGHLRDDTAADRTLHETLQARGYSAVTVGADAVLDTSPYPDLDAYFSGFPSHRRKVMRKERRLFEGTHATVRVDGPAGLTDDLVALQLARYRRYGQRADRDAVRDRFARASKIPGLKVLRADVEEHLLSATAPAGPLGFVAFYEDHRTRRILTRLGAFSEYGAAYFNIAYYELIAHAARTGGMRIHYGDSTYLAKTLRGCRLTRLTSYFRATDESLHDSLARAGRLRTALEEQQFAQALPKVKGRSVEA